ncbi:hypothetical protein PV327_003264 [Microctonus hyperodae]|uniref:G-protein coupled receptors family 1 profile domain-containing protein n=1 Tax=Microctonus hyperodae TaxID=165561 RepID=A0AA39G4K7_MICHY|nr:hypothetical protein PV327_003264 [Microctonus hyperodae]
MTFNHVYVSSANILAVITVLGFSFNFAVLYVIINDRKHLWKPINLIIINLTIQDIFIAIIGCPMAFMAAISHGVFWTELKCKWYALIMTTLGIGNIGSITVMAIERWLMVRMSQTLSVRKAFMLAGAVWIYAFSLSLPPIIGWGKYGPESLNISCSVEWENYSSRNASYIIYLFVLGSIIPIAIIIACYLSIIQHLKKSTVRIGLCKKRDMKVIKMVVLMTVSFIITWTPYSFVALALCGFNYRASPLVLVLPCLFAKSSIIYNPIIYAFLNDQFVKSFKKFFQINL